MGLPAASVIQIPSSSDGTPRKRAVAAGVYLPVTPGMGGAASDGVSAAGEV